MQVISGNNRGLKLNTPDTYNTRPTLSRVKEAVFSSIADYIHAANFLDLFAGTGQIGIEALSRGAKFSVFVDNDIDAVSLIRHNTSKLKADNHSIIQQNAYTALDMLKEKMDIIYIDPPYTYTDLNELLEKIVEKNILNYDDGIIIVEKSATDEFKIPEGLCLYKQKKYGKTNIYYLISKGEHG